MTMCVDPDHQGKGIAGRLLDRGLEEAGKVGQDVYLEATEAGQGLYISRKFEMLDHIPLMDGRVTCYAMMWRHKNSVVNGTKK